MSNLQIEQWDFPETNAQQGYSTHSYFRYFGKLPPTVTRRAIDVGTSNSPTANILDIMCGSGTTLVESSLLGYSATGVDVNPLSLLISRVKTTVLETDILRQHLHAIIANVCSDLRKLGRSESEVTTQLSLTSFQADTGYHSAIPLDYKELLPNMARLDTWFNTDVQQELVCLLY